MYNAVRTSNSNFYYVFLGVTGKTMNFIFSLKEMKMLKLSVIKLKEYSCTTICGRK